MIVRHPIRGLLGGLLLGIGLALVMVQLAFVPLGEWTVIVVVVAFTVLGLLFALLVPARAVPADAAPPPREPLDEPPPTEAV